MTTLITVLQVFSCFLIITFVLLQPSKGGSFFAGSSQGVFGSSGGLSFFFKATMWLAVFLMISSLFLSWNKIQESKSSVVDLSAPVSALPVDAASVPTEVNTNDSAKKENEAPTEASPSSGQ